LPDTDPLHAERERARLEDHAETLIKPCRAARLGGGQLRQGFALRGQAQPCFFKSLLRLHPKCCLALTQFLFCPLSFDPLRDEVCDRCESFKYVREETITREHRQHSNQAILYNQWIAGERNQPLPGGPLLVTHACIV